MINFFWIITSITSNFQFFWSNAYLVPNVLGPADSQLSRIQIVYNCQNRLLQIWHAKYGPKY